MHCVARFADQLGAEPDARGIEAGTLNEPSASVVACTRTVSSALTIVTTARASGADAGVESPVPEMPTGDPANRGAGDISFVAFIDGLVGLGMAGEGSHAPGETADLKSLDIQAKRAALLITRLSKEPRPKR